MKKLNYQEIAMEGLGAGLGAIASAEADKMMPNLNRYMRGGVKFAAGVALKAFMPKNDIAKGAAVGLMGAGIMDAYKQARGIAGIEGIGDINIVDENGESIRVNGEEYINSLEEDNQYYRQLAGVDSEGNPIGSIADEGNPVAGYADEVANY